MRSHLKFVRIAINNKSTHSKCWHLWRKGNLHTMLVGKQTDAGTVENSMEVSKKLKLKLLYDSLIPLLGIYLKKPEILIQKNI